MTTGPNPTVSGAKVNPWQPVDISKLSFGNANVAATSVSNWGSSLQYSARIDHDGGSREVWAQPFDLTPDEALLARQLMADWFGCDLDAGRQNFRFSNHSAGLRDNYISPNYAASYECKVHHVPFQNDICMMVGNLVYRVGPRIQEPLIKRMVDAVDSLREDYETEDADAFFDAVVETLRNEF